MEILRSMFLATKVRATAVNGITWTDDGSCLISFGHDNKLRVWDLDVGQNTFVC